MLCKFFGLILLWMDHRLKGKFDEFDDQSISIDGKFSLGVEPVDHDVLKKPPRKVTDSMIDKRLIANIITSATVIVVGTLCVFYAEVGDQSTKNTNRFGEE